MRQFSPKKKVSRFSRKYGNIEQLWNFGNRKFRNLLIDFLNLFQNLWGLNVMCIHLWLPWVLLDLELVTVTSSLDNRASRSPQWLGSDFIPRPNKILGFWKLLLPCCIKNRPLTKILCCLRNVWVEISTKLTEILKSHGNNVFLEILKFYLFLE